MYFFIPGWNNFNFQQLSAGIQQQIEEYLQNGCLLLHFCKLSVCCVSQVWVGWTVLQLGGFWTIPAQQSPQNNSESGLIMGLCFDLSSGNRSGIWRGANGAGERSSTYVGSLEQKVQGSQGNKTLQVSWTYLSSSFPSPPGLTLLGLVMEFPLTSAEPGLLL